jgi:hypothetical protein
VYRDARVTHQRVRERRPAVVDSDADAGGDRKIMRAQARGIGEGIDQPRREGRRHLQRRQCGQQHGELVAAETRTARVGVAVQQAAQPLRNDAQQFVAVTVSE